MANSSFRIRDGDQLFIGNGAGLTNLNSRFLSSTNPVFFGFAAFVDTAGGTTNATLDAT